LFLSPEVTKKKFKRLEDIEVVENTNIKKKFVDEMGGKIPYKEKIN